MSSCEWYLEGPTGHYLTLRFSNFSLETSSDCSKDYVEIREYNGTGRSVKRPDFSFQGWQLNKWKMTWFLLLCFVRTSSEQTLWRKPSCSCGHIGQFCLCEVCEWCQYECARLPAFFRSQCWRYKNFKRFLQDLLLALQSKVIWDFGCSLMKLVSSYIRFLFILLSHTIYPHIICSLVPLKPQFGGWG